MSGGFRDEDSDFADLLTRQPTLSGSNTPYSYPASDEELATNPFADMESSRALYAPANLMAYSPPSQPRDYYNAPASPTFQPRFTRESAPEPETPSQAPRAASRDYAYTPQPRPTSPSSLASQPFPFPIPDNQTPFGSPPSSPTTGARFGHGRQRSNADNVAALLGEEKPILPTFRREASMGERGPTLHSNAPVLPVSSIGKRSVGGPLAALLGLEEDEVKPALKVTPAPEPKGLPPPTVEAPPTTTEAATAPAQALTIDVAVPPSATSAPPSSESEETTPVATTVSTPQPVDEPPTPTLTPPVLAALPTASATPLPPSPSHSPPPKILPPDDSYVSRASSLAASETSPTNEAYDSMVSPMDTSDGTIEASSGWPGKKAAPRSVEELEGRLEGLSVGDEVSAPTESAPAAPPKDDVEALSILNSSPPPPPASTLLTSPQSPFGQSTFHDTPHVPAVTSPLAVPLPSPFEHTSPTRRGFRSYNGSSFDDGNGFGNGTDDGDSLKGTYSRSVEVEEDAETEERRTGMSSPATEKNREESLRTVGLDSKRASITSGNVSGASWRSAADADMACLQVSLLSSPPLPSIPMPSVQGSPRSTDLGGSLGPSFIITVGDPQKIGSSLNVAAQHTVYTVRTRVSINLGIGAAL